MPYRVNDRLKGSGVGLRGVWFQRAAGLLDVYGH